MFLRGFVLLFLVLMGCQTAPTGRRQLILVSEEQVDAMGAQAFEQIKSTQKVETDPANNQLVQCITNALLAQIESKGAWEVVVFQTPEVNAFALPGQKIGVNTGIIQAAASADRLAAVLGHEIGHVLAQHGRERMSQQVLSDVAVKSAEAATGKRNSTVLAVGMQLGVLLPYSRVHENEADEMGLQLMAKAGFDPRQAVEFWRTMPAKRSIEILSTHPSDAKRIENLSRHLGDALMIYQNAPKALCRR